jgi:DivIVA domain-containing protein
MAMSFSRPDPSSPTSIADASFGTSRRGFDQAEVRDFLRMVAAEFGRLSERERFLERELHAAQAEGSRVTVDEAMMTQILGEEAVRVLTTARESANEIRDKAEQAASQLLHEAGDEASRVREEADIEASRRRADAGADAESELAMAKQQGREMVNEARAYRERVLSELARRRELAREQIEQLIHGRDRLMQAFERARLVAVDVVAEMQPLGEPDEYVNLTPTTGPLPVMIANSPRPDDAETHDLDENTVEAPAEESVDSQDEPTVDATAGLRIIEIEDDRSVDAVDAAADIADIADMDDDEVNEGDDEVDDLEVVDVADDDIAESDDDSSDDVNVETEMSGDEDEDDEDDDVVVDLFARLRADATEVEQPDVEADNAVWSAEVLVTPTEDQAAVVEVGAADDAADDLNDGDADVEQTAFEYRDEVITPLIVSSAKKLKRALADEQNDVLDALRRSDAVHTIDALLPRVGEHAGHYTEAVADDLLEAVHAGSATSRTLNRKIRKATATDAVGVANDVLTQWLVMPLRERLIRCITEGEGDNAVVTKKVRAVYREWKTQFIDETLDDVMRCAHGRGVLAGFDHDTPIVWEVDTRFAACPDCDDNALAGAIAAGGQFPTGDSFAPAHQGCRCLLVAADR